MLLEEILAQNHQLDPASIAEIAGSGKITSYPKGHLLIEEGKLAKNCFILIQGSVKAHLNHEGKDIAFWFGFDGDILFSYNSKLLGLPGYESITSLEKCQVFEISNERIETLCRSNIRLALWWNRIIELELIKAEKRLIDRQCKPAEQRYRDLVSSQPELLNRISLGNIASYLGISQVSLSRIRSLSRA
ncbi:Crp/Fnr family transcriptional regulator [Echinicola pacifica]|uniref:Crp/Fnr family transcriptional regulator n=1 Tax=Echinicola pacifica TaxID=346377 RepID=UPI00037168C1|nr:Crp/Fnr family transcriptional regulator [Echinicola pacifica]